MKSSRYQLPAAIAIVISIASIFFAIDSRAIIDGGEGLNADQLIDASRGDYVFNNGMPENPQASRKLWNEETGTNFTMTGKLAGNGSNPQEARSSAKTGETLSFQTASAVNSGQEKAASSPEQIVSPASSSASGPESDASSLSLAPDLAGNWSFKLKDNKNRFVAVRLYQTDSILLGSGNMNDGGDTLKVLASGLISADKLYLDVISSGTVNLYRLSLNLSGSSASGEYRAFSTSGEAWTGTVEGTLAKTLTAN
jgi:hypothetical protein